jgi:hypothetical protein
MFLGAFIDARVKLCSRGIENDDTQMTRAFMRFRPRGLLLGHCRTGLQSHLDCTLHAWPISWKQFRGALFIKPLQQSMEVFSAAAFPQQVKSVAQILIGLRADKKWISQGAQVEAGAAYEYRQATATLDFLNRRRRLARPVASRVIDIWRNEIDEMMGNPAAFCERNFGSSDPDALIHLHRVAVNDLTAEVLGNFDSQRAFAGSSWTNDCDNAGSVGVLLA